MNPRTKLFSIVAASVLTALAGCATTAHEVARGATSLHGYVLDSACAYIKNLEKPISPDCALQCARAGSPLVILADDGHIYLPISSAMPAVGQNERLMPFAGRRVIVTGTSYVKGASGAFVIDKIEPE